MSDSRWSRWGKSSEKKLGFGKFFREAEEQHGHNPTGNGMESPAEKATRMGLVSDGHGAYADPQTGEVVARTVNGELVFYDGGSGGGVASDGEGGGEGGSVTAAAVTPVYTDPDTGLAKMPSAQPSTPAERDQVPAHTPATAPAGMEKFIAKKQDKAARKNDLVARMTAAFDRNLGDQPPEPTAASDAAAVDKAREMGMDTGEAHEGIHGEVDLNDPEALAKLAATYNRIGQSDGSSSITPDKDSTSLFAQDQAKALEEPEAEAEPEATEVEPEAAPEPIEPGSVDNIEDANATSSKKYKNERERLIGEYKKNLLDSFDKQDSEIESELAPVRETINEILSQTNAKGQDLDDLKDQYAAVMALASTYAGRIRHGEGKRTMVYNDAQVLLNPEVQEGLRTAYGDGSPEQIEKFVNSRKIVDTPASTVDKLWKVLPKEFKGALASGNLGSTLNLLDEKDGKVKRTPVDKEHYGGEDNRVSNASGDRKKLLLKLFLDQGGRDGYTGQPLDPRYMELEHVRGLQSLDDGEVAPTLDQIRERENIKNWMWVATGVNNEKSDLNMDTFLNNVNKKHSKMKRSDYVDLDAADEAFKEKNSGISSLLDGMFENKRFSSSVTPEVVSSLFENELAESKAMHRNGIKKTPINMGNAIRQQLGMVKDQKLTRSQVKTSKELFRPIIEKIVSSPEGKRDEMVKQYNDLFHQASDKTTELGALGSDAESDPNAIFKTVKGKKNFNEKATWETFFYKSLAEAGLIDAESIDKSIQPKEAEKFKKIIFEEGYHPDNEPSRGISFEQFRVSLD